MLSAPVSAIMPIGRLDCTLIWGTFHAPVLLSMATDTSWPVYSELSPAPKRIEPVSSGLKCVANMAPLVPPRFMRGSAKVGCWVGRAELPYWKARPTGPSVSREVWDGLRVRLVQMPMEKPSIRTSPICTFSVYEGPDELEPSA